MLSFFGVFGEIKQLPEDKEDRKVAKLISRVLVKNDKKAYEQLSGLHKEIIELYSNEFAKESIESFLFCEDVSMSEISEILEIDEETLDEYAYWFCNVGFLNTYFKKKMWIETELKKVKNKAFSSELTKDERLIWMLNLKSILFKRWALLLGKEFVIWKFGLKKIDVTTNNFLDAIAKEAFFYYKEISLSEKELEHSEYVKIVSSLVKTIKEINAAMLQNGASDNLVHDIQEALNIIIEEDDPRKNISKPDGEFVCNSKIN